MTLFIIRCRFLAKKRIFASHSYTEYREEYHMYCLFMHGEPHFNVLIYLRLPLLQIMVNFYRPQRSCGKVMFSQTSVILFTRGGVCVADTPGQTPPAQCMPGYTPPPSACWDSHPPRPVHAGICPQPATAVDGTHPTGMHSCLNLFFILYLLNSLSHSLKTNRNPFFNWCCVQA